VPFTEDPWGWLQSCILPAVSLALLQIGLIARITRSTMLEAPTLVLSKSVAKYTERPPWKWSLMV
jgi:hypothetical protein